MAAAPEIVRRLRETDVTAAALRAEYGCGYILFKRAVLSQGVSETEFRALMLKRVSRPGGGPGSFRTGHEAWNKGHKGISYPGCEPTQFKKGCLRGKAARNWRPVGAIVVWAGSKKGARHKRRPRRMIKVRDEGPRAQQWVPYARYLWERDHGPVPEGCFVGHRDNDPLNDDPSNLILLDCATHMRRLNGRPEVRAKARESLRRALTRQKKADGIRPTAHVWDCEACAAEFETETDRCPKCGGYAITRRPIYPIPTGETP